MGNVRKRVIALLGASFIATATFGANIVQANNWKDTEYNFYFTNQHLYTNAREKEDKSKLYMNCTGISNTNGSYSARAFGTNSSTSYGVDESDGGRWTYIFKAGVKHYMSSNVKEHGYKYARIRGTSLISQSFKATTQWSPDNYAGIGN